MPLVETMHLLPHHISLHLGDEYGVLSPVGHFSARCVGRSRLGYDFVATAMDASRTTLFQSHTEVAASVRDPLGMHTLSAVCDRRIAPISKAVWERTFGRLWPSSNEPSRGEATESAASMPTTTCQDASTSRVIIGPGPFVRALISVDAWPSAAAQILDSAKEVHEMTILYSGDDPVHLSITDVPRHLKHLTFRSLSPYTTLYIGAGLLVQLSKLQLSGVHLHVADCSGILSQQEESYCWSFCDAKLPLAEIINEFGHLPVTGIDVSCTSLTDFELKGILEAWKIERVNISATHVSPECVEDLMRHDSIRCVDAAWLGVSSDCANRIIQNLPGDAVWRF